MRSSVEMLSVSGVDSKLAQHTSRDYKIHVSFLKIFDARWFWPLTS